MKGPALIGIFAGSLTFASSMLGQPTSLPANAVETAAKKTFIRCASNAALDLDDQKSDAAKIALDMQIACYQQFDAMLDAYSRRLDRAGAQTFKDTAHAHETELLVDLVHQERAERATDSNQPRSK